MPDQVLTRDGPVSVPMEYQVPQGGELIPLTVNATMDGTSAASAFYAAVQIVAPSGRVMASAISTSIAAGASASVTWFPRVAAQTLQSGSGIPPFPALDDYVFQHANTTVTGVGFNDQTALIIQGNPVTLDGATRIKIEFFAPLVEIANAANVNNQALGFSLWDGGTNKGVIGFVEAGNYVKTNPAFGSEFGGPCYGVIIDTPAAGAHTYAIYAFLNTAAGASTNTVFGSTFIDGTGNLGPCWYRVTTT